MSIREKYIAELMKSDSIIFDQDNIVDAKSFVGVNLWVRDGQAILWLHGLCQFKEVGSGDIIIKTNGAFSTITKKDIDDIFVRC